MMMPTPRAPRPVPLGLVLLVLGVGACFVGVGLSACKSGGASGGAAVSSAALFERQPKRGELSFIIRSNGQNGQTVGDVAASFTERSSNDGGTTNDLDAGAPPDCEPVVIGPCVVISCVQGTPVGGAGSKNVAPAGDITIADTTAGKSQVFTASAGGYQFTGQSSIPAKPGDSITFTAAGGEVPAFSQTLVAPLAITPSPFACPDAAADASPSSCPISRSQDLAVGWSGGDHGSAVVTLSSFGGGCNNPQSCPPLQSTAVCKFDVSGGAGTIPKAVLSRFPESNVQIGYAAEDTLDFAEGSYVVRASAVVTTQSQISLPLVQ